MVNRKDWISDFIINPQVISLANNAQLKSVGIVDIEVSIDGNLSKVTGKDVLYIPNVATNLLSVSKIAEKGNICIL